MYKRTTIKKTICILFTTTITAPLYAQFARLSIEGNPVVSQDKFPERRDINGRPCAVIKVISELEGFGYDAYNGIVGNILDKQGEDLVYLSPDERVLMILHSGYEPLKIILPEIGIRLKENQMWLLKIKADLLKLLPVTFIIDPSDAQLVIHGRSMGQGPTYQLSPGRYPIKIVKERYYTLNDTIDIDLSNVVFQFQLVFKTEFILVKGGSFKMGDTLGDGENDEKPVHQVTLNNFYLSKYEVTFSEFNAFCEATGRKNPSDYGYGAGLRAMNFVNWYDAVEYCNWRSEQEGLNPCYRIDKTRNDPNNLNKEDDVKWMVTCDFSANGYRLPTEAEWEYAARERGRKVRFGNGKDIADPEEINFLGLQQYKESYSIVGVYRGKTTAVGSFAPNALELYDMSGNVWEWCWDWYAGYEVTSQNNPGGPESGEYRVLRGGSWINKPGGIRAANRFKDLQLIRDDIIGFRLAKTF